MSRKSQESEGKSGALGTLIKSVVSGSVIAIVGIGIWGGLLSAAQANPHVLPYVVPAMSAVLLIGAAYLKWVRWPRTGYEFRRAGVRLSAVSAAAFFTSLAAGWSTMLCGFLVYVAHRSLAGLGGEGMLHFPQTSFANLAPGLLMAGIVAGVVEEVAFRGFMQGTLERRFGIVPAIAVSGLLWAAFHLNHSYFAEEPLLWPAIFLAVATILGTIAHRTDSLIPGIAVHSGFDAAYFLLAGYLAPRTSPIVFIQSVMSPPSMIAVAGLAGAVALISWLAFFRATAERRMASALAAG
ncbi:MAG: CPBP family intramembrane metalloprotease [Alphaproteobacteria bacterium]|nr:CPBP family intramembrane metalloprotease [Alphaproteobacteria bacterium]